MKKWLNILAIALLIILIITGIGVYLNIPELIKVYLHSREAYGDREYNSMVFLLYTSGVPAITMLILCVMLIRNIIMNKPFVYNNVRILNGMGICGLLICAIFIIISPYMISFFPPFMAVVFLVLSLVLLIVANLFKIAITYKEENDLTI